MNKLSTDEAARELFAAGYLQALDDVVHKLSLYGVRSDEISLVNDLRSKPAAVLASAAIIKATEPT